MHFGECVLIMAISIFMIIASLLLFARSINLHLLPADWQLNLAGHHWAAGVQAPQHTNTPSEDAGTVSTIAGIVSHTCRLTHTSRQTAWLTFTPVGVITGGYPSPAAWGSACCCCAPLRRQTRRPRAPPGLDVGDGTLWSGSTTSCYLYQHLFELH